jgi:UPF0716 family protein affecting phage T7 exclusion
MGPDEAQQRLSFGTFLRAYRDYYRGQRSARLQLVSVCCLLLAGMLRSPGATIGIIGLTVLVVGPIAYGLWRWKQHA